MLTWFRMVSSKSLVIAARFLFETSDLVLWLSWLLKRFFQLSNLGHGFEVSFLYSRAFSKLMVVATSLIDAVHLQMLQRNEVDLG